MTFAPVQKVSAYEAIVAQIEDAIARGNLKPGDRLPGERRLMEDFSVSRATIREALRVLQATGVIDSRPGDPRGPVISEFSPRLLEKSLTQLAQVQGTSRLELIQFRLTLEGGSAFLAARNHTPEGLALIEARLEEMRSGAAEDGAFEFHQKIRAFHDAIRAATGNQMFVVVGSVISDVMAELMAKRIASDSNPTGLVARSAEDGIRLTEAIRERRAEDARDTQISNIYRFYEDGLTEDERRLLGPTPEHAPVER